MPLPGSLRHYGALLLPGSARPAAIAALLPAPLPAYTTFPYADATAMSTCHR
jgi:hypothetical protein